MFETMIEMFSYPFMVRAFLVGSLVALCSALLGVSLVLKRYSMIGDGLSHVGFGAMAVAAELISRYGPDSLVGRTAAVTLGSTETTFYTASVYFGSLGIKRTRYAIPAALCADLAGFVGASFFTRLLMG